MITFHGKQEIKDALLAQIEKHRQADEIVQGYGYWRDGKGCAIGCMVHSRYHRALAKQIGVPVAIIYLVDSLFEAMPKIPARSWPGRFVGSTPVGVDLAAVMVEQQFVHWLLVDSVRLVGHVKTNTLLTDCAALYRLWIDGAKPSYKEYT
jgi:hypothetical protein